MKGCEGVGGGVRSEGWWGEEWRIKGEEGRLGRNERM